MLNIDPRSSKPIYEQIVDEIKANIVKGILKPGEKLPSVRELSKIITVNPNTVSKAYSELERQKVIDTVSGRGTFVSANYKPRDDDDRLNKIKSSIKDAIIEAYYIGLGKEDIIHIVDEAYKAMKGE
ncbi:GntR family transcriptional regulator [Pseudobacteroides cellulosolvens]|uniref:Transcriptional regulator, GntR family n=1 Tax=Pseudobacteroides cellulosolvens ATCC 35603 = DSM 2933 TaxID=398512 RepID=A0A0L6JTT3_9FIRM|nr:GntR family transcriptional regulator [Pseudobacteroides cellulosolvens]KNY29246.1 transcriptional regulator, GntR family [Pseudobacteroides cellulosolvens ATCC 35603 = DSM 2933]